MSNPLQNSSQLIIKQRYLPHWELAGSVYFVTFKTWQKLKLSTDARQIVLNCCLFFDQSINCKDARYQTFIIVIMPDHVHWLLQPLPKIDKTILSETSETGKMPVPRVLISQNKLECWSLSSILHSVKSYSSKQIPKVMKHIGTIWQDERYDRIIRNRREFLNTWKYIQLNPVKAHLSDTPENYPYLWETF
ncbi:transposase [Crocosphaera sp. UHCC 0190]|uniref:transposase n=1 Tax=Crocosphaera sp. UHCC 0190 TaxID=3110246 RepID=UPI002B1ECCC9|nr:transposase [Crocosphaera sp. UHCC 0190]MEA5510326.1 transposase [Crocosphaera sp. UHCC 0190]